MAPRMPVALMPLLLAAAVVVAGCSGSRSNVPGTPVDDPAAVPTSTPLQNPTLYLIRGNSVVVAGSGSAAATASPTTPDKSYTIQSGDTCSAIAAKFGITLTELESANGSTSGAVCSSLKPGQTLYIPQPTATATATGTPAPSGFYTLGNGGAGTALTATGTPTPTPTPGGAGSGTPTATTRSGSSSRKTYTVQSGDTCFGIATRLGVSATALQNANGGANGACLNLQIGQILTVP